MEGGGGGGHFLIGANNTAASDNLQIIAQYICSLGARLDERRPLARLISARARWRTSTNGPQ